MSTIIATTLSNGSVSVPTATVVNGSAKAWVNFNGTGTIAARDSFNVASLTDNGAGDYTVNFSGAFSSANYSLSGTASNLVGASDNTAVLNPRQSGGAFLLYSTTQCRVSSFSYTGSTFDTLAVGASFHGDLA